MPEKLFDDGPYALRPYALIHEATGVPLGDGDRSCEHYGRVVFRPTNIYVPIIDSNSVECLDAGSYRHDTLPGIFRFWAEKPVGAERANTEHESFEGFIAGLPLLSNGDSSITAIHLWDNYSSVLDNTIAVPLRDIVSLELYPQGCLSFMISLGEQTMGGTPGLEPVLLDNVTGEIHRMSRSVVEDDVDNIIDRYRSERSLVFSSDLISN